MKPSGIYETKTRANVLLIWEDSACRHRATRFCKDLERRFWAQCHFQFDWCALDILQRKETAEQAAAQALESDLLVFALQSERPLPAGFTRWIESWAGRRPVHEGALIGLFQPAARAPLASNREIYLRHLAHRLGMDYLTGVPSSLFEPVPNSLESYADRAGRVSTVLQGILHQPTNDHARLVQTYL
jgi:hypothetical protein